MSEFTRRDVVRVVRSLVGRRPNGRPLVPFRHQGRDPATGLDCAGVLVWAAHQLGHLVEVDFRAYERYPSHLTLRTFLDAHLARRPPHRVLPGDVLLLSGGTTCPTHVGVVLDGPGRLHFAHAYIKVRGVVECRLPTDREWEFTRAGAYCYRPLDGQDWA
jgi:hypothetical protein